MTETALTAAGPRTASPAHAAVQQEQHGHRTGSRAPWWAPSHLDQWLQKEHICLTSALQDRLQADSSFLTECGPACRCSPAACSNRRTQQGLQMDIHIKRTDKVSTKAGKLDASGVMEVLPKSWSCMSNLMLNFLLSRAGPIGFCYAPDASRLFRLRVCWRVFDCC